MADIFPSGAVIYATRAEVRELRAEVARLHRRLDDGATCQDSARIADILRVVAADYGLPRRLIPADWRRADIVEARWVVMWIARTALGRSCAAIGLAIGRRDRTTVMYGVEQVEARRARDAEFRARTDRLRASLTPEEGQP